MPKSKTKEEIAKNVKDIIGNANKKAEKRAATKKERKFSRQTTFKTGEGTKSVEYAPSVPKNPYSRDAKGRAPPKPPGSRDGMPPRRPESTPKNTAYPRNPDRAAPNIKSQKHSLMGRLKGWLNMEACWDGYKVPKEKKFKKKNGKLVPNCIPEELMEVLKKHQNPEGGLNQAGRDHYNRKTGSKLQKPVSAKEASRSERSAARRRSFCARMKGVSGPMEKDGKPTRKALALRKWDCN